MNWALVLAFLFAVGSILGWGLEFGFRNLISHKGPKGMFFINPGFCRGPYLPIYGFGLSVMFVISYYLTPDSGSVPALLIVLLIGVTMSVIEFLGGLFLYKFLNMRLWDYSKFKGNIMGFVCPQFGLVWLALGAVYYLLIHPIAINGLIWLSQNLAFSFVIGLFFGLFIPDFIASQKDALIIREFAQDHDVVVKYEELKALVQEHRLSNDRKARFFNQIANEDSALFAFLVKHKDLFKAIR